MNEMHSGRGKKSTLLTKPNLSVKPHEMHFCYSEIVCHFAQECKAPWELQLCWKIEMQEDSRSSSAAQSKRVGKKTHYHLHERFQTAAMQMSRLSLRSTDIPLALSMPAE